MAKKDLPDPLSRRHLLEGDLDPAKAFALAEAYLAADREIEAVDFLAVAHAGSHAEAADRLVALRVIALEQGDVFLMRAASAALGEEPSTEKWRALADAASRAGRERDAETAMRLATVGG